MNIDIAKGGEISREAVWLTAWCVVATSNSCTSKAVAANWADACLAEFDTRFPAKPETPNAHD